MYPKEAGEFVYDDNVRLKTKLGFWKTRWIRVFRNCVVVYDSDESYMPKAIYFPGSLARVIVPHAKMEVVLCFEKEPVDLTLCRIKTSSYERAHALAQVFQMILKAKTSKAIPRLVRTISSPSPIEPPQLREAFRPEWYYLDQLDSWRKAPQQLQIAIRQAKGKKLSEFQWRDKRAIRFSVNFDQMTLTNIATGYYHLLHQFQEDKLATMKLAGSLTLYRASAKRPASPSGEAPTIALTQQITELCRQSKEPFVDPSFAPVAKSLYFKGKVVLKEWECGHCSRSNSPESTKCASCPAHRVVVCKWLRPAQIRSLKKTSPWKVFDAVPSADDIQQGALGNCWFLSALAVLAERPELLRRLILTPEYNPAGVYIVRLCFDGVWTKVLVDDLFPCTHIGTLAYSQCRRNQLWVPLIEKAMAKFYGCYEAIGSGQVYDGLSILTGYPVEKLDLRPERNELSGRASMSGRGNADEDLLWTKLLSFREASYLMGASCGIFEDEAQTGMHEAVGLHTFHAYSVLDIRGVGPHRLIKLRNPWGINSTRQWSGDWSPHSELWTRELRAELKEGTQAAHTGTFWMSFQDLRRYFGRIDVCKVHSNWHEQRLTTQPLSFNAGYQQVFEISSSDSNQIDISLHQPSLRGKDPDLNMMDIGLALLRETSHRTYELVADSRRSMTSYVSLQAFLNPKQKYLIVPLGFNKLNLENSLLEELRVVVYSSKPLEIIKTVKSVGLVGTVMGLRARKHGKLKQIFQSMFIYTQNHDAGTVVYAENRHPEMLFEIEMDNSESFNVTGSRRTMKTVDKLRPGQAQVIQILSQVTDAGYSWSSKVHYNRSKVIEEQHDPPVQVPGMHAPHQSK